MNRTDDILKTLDPADRTVDPHGPRARADLQRILTTDAAADPGPLAGVLAISAFRPRRKRLTGTRIALASGLVAATAVAAIVLPSATGGDEAFATWTAAPSGMSAKERADATSACRKEQKSGDTGRYADDLAKAGTAIAERRGAWTLVVLAGSNGFSALCITDRSTQLFRDYFGSVGHTASLPGPRELTATGLGVGAANSHELSVATGHAGADVTAVSYTSSTRGKVVATVSGGHFALWFPGDELDTASRRGVPVRVTYRDGSTRTVMLTL